MAEDSSQEKTEDATPRRVREARKKGQVAKSRDLNTIVILIAAFAGMLVLFQMSTEDFRALFQQVFEFTKQREIDNRELFHQLGAACISMTKILAPYLGLLTVIALAVGFLQTGPIFATEPIQMQMKRLNIVENVKNMAKITTLIELVKNILKVSLVFFLAYWVLKKSLNEVLLTMTASPLHGAEVAQRVLTAFLIRVFVVFIVLAIIDIMVQRWQYKKQLRMTKDEVKREYKQDEGDPLIKSMRRQLHQEMAQSDVRKAVAAADMVVTNPTELAIALKYDTANMAAPQVLAKGQRLFAQLIREVAEEYDVPIMRNIPLAWALIELEIGDEIPESLYTAVAELLLIVYRMREQQKQPTAPQS
ncbi:MAG: EscU/YscU/HrcU family type III secretion system export apparatus switch protein [Deltaproteobacteria bacterium]|nr:EscU/YscU/HrcU family type III secretion system export apparatus switch protein [Deltaproteobacteria bacterium]